MEPQTNEAPEASKASSVRERLAAQKTAGSELLNGVLPVSGIGFTYPGFIGHNKVMAAQKIAGKNGGVNAVLLAQVCLFEGERLTVEEIRSMDFRDVNELTEIVLGVEDEDGEDDSGN